MKKFKFLISIIVCACINYLLSGCITEKQPTQTDIIDPQQEIKTRITLQNQDDHLGILVNIVELNALTMTDSSGAFSFKNLPDGQYTLIAKYPYFASTQDSVEVKNDAFQNPVDIELKQLLQFWIEPPETTVSYSNPSLRFRLFIVNLADTIVQVGGYNGPPFFRAFSPQGFDWPSDTTVNCQHFFETFKRGETLEAPQFVFIPGDTVSSIIFSSMYNNCFLPGEYRYFSAVTDLSHYPEYFDPDFFLSEDSLYFKMNQSILKKYELFNPATIHLME